MHGTNIASYGECSIGSFSVSSRPQPQAALFDLDRTLIDCNSGWLWMLSERRAGRLPLWMTVWGGWWLFRYSLGYCDLAEAYAKAVSRLKGLPEESIRQRTQVWFSEQVQPRLRPGAQQVLRRYRDEGVRLVVATSSSLYAAQAAQQAFGLDDAIATVFEVQDEVFTGRLHASAYGDAKATRAQEWAEAAGVSLQECAFFTDSISDIALLELVGFPVVVNPDRKLAAMASSRGWPIEDWGKSGDH